MAGDPTGDDSIKLTFRLGEESMHSAENDVLAVAYDAYGGPEVLKLRSIPAPPLAQDQVLIEVRAASMNPVDWKVRSGMLQKFFPVAFPTITGRDGAGEVIAAAADADASLVGKRVCFLAQRGAGTWSQKIALQASLAVPIPSGISYEEAASLPLAGISAWVGLVQTADVKPGMRVLIHAAAGGVGSMAVQIARLRGATVIATCSGRNVDFVRALGAQEAIPYDQTAFEERARDIDVVFDVIGGDVHRRSYAVLKRGGIIVALAAAPFEDESARWGVKLATPQVLSDPAILAEIVELVAAGTLKPCVERVLPIADFAKAHQMSQIGHARGKTVLVL
jgi:NADPH:quinone reductase-like Zn-dependent oxidoreductase